MYGNASTSTEAVLAAAAFWARVTLGGTIGASPARHDVVRFSSM